MKAIRIQMQDYEKRRMMVEALAFSSYKVWVEYKSDINILVCFECELEESNDNPNASRDELIKELINKFPTFKCSHCEYIADFILADRARIVEPLVKEIEELKLRIKSLQGTADMDDYANRDDRYRT